MLTDNFQDLIIGACINHPGDFTCYGPILNSKHFSGVHATIAAKVLTDYHTRRGTFPTWVIFEQMVVQRAGKVGLDSNEEDNAREYINRVKVLAKEGIRSPADVEHVASHVVEFARHQAMVIAIKKNIELLKEGKDINTAICEQALAIGQNLLNMGVLLSGDDPELALSVIDNLTSHGYGIRTGYPILDGIWKNGWGPGWLIVPLAPPKRMKTTLCINFAMNIAGPAIGEDVLYYTCEISDELAALRAMCRTSGLSTDYMYANPEKFKDTLRVHLKQFMSGEILFKGFASRSATIQDIKAHAKMAIEQGLRPKAIIIDYADTIKPSSSHKEKKDHLLQADVYTEARALGFELKCPVIMPDRCTRETVELPVPNMQSFQGAFEKAGIVDVAIGICGTDAEIQNGVLRFFVFLNRHGPALQHIQGRIDADAFMIEMNEFIPYNPDEAKPEGRRRGGIPKQLIEGGGLG